MAERSTIEAKHDSADVIDDAPRRSMRIANMEDVNWLLQRRVRWTTPNIGAGELVSRMRDEDWVWHSPASSE